eukprot:3516373-Prymnesium_polylepis.1
MMLELLRGPSPWVTLRVSEGTAIGMLPFCTPAGGPNKKNRLWPDSASSGSLLAEFATFVGGLGA